MSNENSFLIVLEAGKSKIKVLCLMRASLAVFEIVLQMLRLHLVEGMTGQKEPKLAPSSPFIRHYFIHKGMALVD
jgi:hypothetical protein